jgi:hypothetical protein
MHCGMFGPIASTCMLPETRLLCGVVAGVERSCQCKLLLPTDKAPSNAAASSMQLH